MTDRTSLLKAIRFDLKNKSHAYLHGPRGAGKTTLVQQLCSDPVRYIDCEDPNVQADLKAPEGIAAGVTEPMLILDEFHACTEFSALLDAFLKRGKKVLAVSSALRSPPLTPRAPECTQYQIPALRADEFPEGTSLGRRLLLGGMAEAHRFEQFSSQYFSRWHDSVLLRDLRAYGRLIPKMFHGS